MATTDTISRSRAEAAVTVRDAVELLLQAEHELRADAASDLRNRLESSRRELHKIGDELAELADT